MKHKTRPPQHEESYVHSYNGAATKQVFSGRTAEHHAAFFLPHLKRGMSLLDCGSGPGSITAGLAKAVSPGEVTGIEIEASQVDLARENAAKLGLTNIKFEQGSAYELPYPDNRFDAVFSHAMLEHLTNPVLVVKEMRRVLKPGGIVGIRCANMSMRLLAPSDETLDLAYEIYLKYRQHCGGNPAFGRQCRALLREAGFTETIGTASCDTWGTKQATRAFVPFLLDELTGSEIRKIAIQKGWADQTQMDKAVTAINQWGEHPDAIFALVWFEAVARKENTI
jgi:ubiquinone/menaquinone biosynthesis C-methylase UbiE